MKKYVAKWLTGFLVCLLGGTLTLAFAPYGVFPFAVLAPAALMTLWIKKTPFQAFRTGFLFGLGYFGFGVYWIFISVHDFGGLPAIGAIPVTGFVIVFLSMFPALTGYFLNKRFNPALASTQILAFPAIWVILEWVRTWLFTGFPWLFIGYSQHQSPLAGYAPFLSVYGVSLVTLITAGLLTNIIQQSFKRNFFALYINCFVIGLLWVTGGLLYQIKWTEPHGDMLSVNLVQGNIPQEIKWSPEHITKSMEVYRGLTEPLLKKDSLIVWPEAAIPLPLLEAGEYIQDMDNKATASGAHIILGIPIKAQNQPGYYNAIVTLGDSKQVYLKRKLVPYGEYIPFYDQFAGIFDFMDIPMSNFVKGKHSQPPIILGKNRISASICYEIAYPELTRIRHGNINLILTVTNDAWFGDSPAQAQHLEIAQMRALELQRPILFATNDGLTAIIGPEGRIQEMLPPHEATVLISRIQPVSGSTPWMRFGIDPLFLIMFSMLLVAAWNSKKHKLKG